jgi:hypothetical protein
LETSGSGIGGGSPVSSGTVRGSREREDAETERNGSGEIRPICFGTSRSSILVEYSTRAARFQQIPQPNKKKMKDRSARLRCGTQHTLNTAILVFPYKMGVTFTSCWSGRTPRITSVPTAFSVTDSINLLTTGRLTCKRVQPIIL